jgi:hypothetical protein
MRRVLKLTKSIAVAAWSESKRGDQVRESGGGEEPPLISTTVSWTALRSVEKLSQGHVTNKVMKIEEYSKLEVNLLVI